MDPRLNDFFNRHDGRRLDVRDHEPIERGMTTEHLREEVERYGAMLDKGTRPTGERLSGDERAEITAQSMRFRSEIARREGRQR